MKFSEAIARLEKNRKLKFQTQSGNKRHELYMDHNGFFVLDIYSLIDGDLISCELGGGQFSGNVRYDYDWQLVRTPVTWQEAIQAWAEDKGIECECKSCGGGHADSCKFNSRNDDDDFCKQGIKSGVWFILDGDADE